MKIYRVRIHVETEEYIAANSDEEAQEILSDNIQEIMDNADDHDADLAVVQSAEYMRDVVPYTAKDVEEKTLGQWIDDCETTPDNWVDPRQTALGFPDHK